MKSYVIDFSISPWIHFERLISEAQKNKILEYNAMDLATVNSSGQPNVRIVYYKMTLREGLGFFTNYQGQKAHEIADNSKVAVNFYWRDWNQQVRAQGTVEKMTRAESEAYFKTRARLSQLGAWASHQSEEIASLEVLEKRLAHYEQKFAGQDVPCPPQWGGFLIKPHYFEFWMGREGRLHERYVYEKNNFSDSSWKTYLKSP